MLIIISKFVLVYNNNFFKTKPRTPNLTPKCRAKMYFVVFAWPPSSEDADGNDHSSSGCLMSDINAYKVYFLNS